jgi:hypothetical protein
MNIETIAVSALAAVASFLLLSLLLTMVARCSDARRESEVRGPVRQDLMIGRLAIEAKGREVFTPRLLAGRVYRFTFTGYYEFWTHGIFFNDHTGWADALLHTDGSKNFVHQYNGLRVDGRRLGGSASHDERHEHKYGFLVDGTDSRIPIQLVPPVVRGKQGYAFGGLGVTIELLPVGTPSVEPQRRAAAEAKAKAEEEARAAEAARQQLETEQRRLEEARLAAEAAAREAEQRRQEAEEKVRKLVLLAHRERNLFDAGFRYDYVRKHRKEILKTVRDQWASEYDELMLNEELVALLKEQAPQVLEWYESRHKIILLAERLAVSPALEGREGPLSLTPSAIPHVEGLIRELIEWRDQQHNLYKQQAYQEKDLSDQLDPLARVSAFNYQQLKRYGICASTPEEAEDQFGKLCPKDVTPEVIPDPYHELRQRLLAGDTAVGESLKERAQDLWREKKILAGQRRAALKNGQTQLREVIDRRLIAARQEAAELHGVLESAGIKVELKYPGDPEKQASRKEQFLQLHGEKEQIIEILRREVASEETIEHVEALYAEAQAKIFDPGDEYT